MVAKFPADVVKQLQLIHQKQYCVVYLISYFNVMEIISSYIYA